MNERTESSCTCRDCQGAGCACGCQTTPACSRDCACGPQCNCGSACNCVSPRGA